MPDMVVLLPCLVLEVYLWKLWSHTSGVFSLLVRLAVSNNFSFLDHSGTWRFLDLR